MKLSMIWTRSNTARLTSSFGRNIIFIGGRKSAEISKKTVKTIQIIILTLQLISNHNHALYLVQLMTILKMTLKRPRIDYTQPKFPKRLTNPSSVSKAK